VTRLSILAFSFSSTFNRYDLAIFADTARLETAIQSKSGRIVGRRVMDHRLLLGQGMPPPAHGLVRQPHGFTLIEVLVVIAVLVTAVVGIAQIVIVTARSNRGALDTSMATLIGTARMEELRLQDWDDAQLIESPAGTLASNVSGYVDYVDQFGSPIAMSAGQNQPPSGAVFVRRWAIRPTADASGMLLVQVIVLRQSDSHAAVLSQLTGTRTRRAW
jgi:prepilin-type N-terminal cleavage/methylation domain-containing protein